MGEFETVSAAVLNLFPPLAHAEAKVALTLYRLLAHGEAVSIDAVARAAGISKRRAEALVSGWPDAYRDGEGRIVGYGGLTIARTKHRLIVGGRTLYTWCAWDTIFIPALLGASALVESTCPATDDKVALDVFQDKIVAVGTQPLVSFVAPRADAGADIVKHFCCHVHFLANAPASREWVEKRPGVVLLRLNQAWQLGRERNARRYPVVQA